MFDIRGCLDDATASSPTVTKVCVGTLHPYLSLIESFNPTVTRCVPELEVIEGLEK